MKILFAARENAWGGFLQMIRSKVPEHQFQATGKFEVPDIRGFEVLIPTMCPIDRSLIEKSDRLRLIQQCGSGIEGVDLDAAREHGIWVANVPTESSGNADSVAEMGIFMMIGLSRNVRGMAESLRKKKMGQPQGRALSGRTVGLVGLGGIGRALVRRLKVFDVRLMGIKSSNPQDAKKRLGLDWCAGPDQLESLLERSDFVVLCLPHTPETEHIINRQTIAVMRSNAFLINLSRGGLVDRAALKEALAKGWIAGAGLDVFWQEPPDPDDPIFQYNVMATPHIAGSTDQSMQGIVKAVAENIRRLAENKTPHYLQNLRP
jgi:phosphoglycerate dehydrogenase-like enzyme